jgi:hypothetical protein
MCKLPGTAVTRIVPTFFINHKRITDFEVKFGEYDTICELGLQATTFPTSFGLKGFTAYCGSIAGSKLIQNPSVTCLKAESFYCTRSGKLHTSRKPTRVTGVVKYSRTPKKTAFDLDGIKQYVYNRTVRKSNNRVFVKCPTKQAEETNELFNVVRSKPEYRIDSGKRDEEITQNSCFESEPDGIECKRGFAFCGFHASKYGS